MSLRVVGAGLGRTGTLSLKLALEQLLGAPCHHMLEVFGHPEQIAGWHGATHGSMPDWKDFLAPYAATVDWPAAAFWPELCEAFPDAIVLLSVRDAGDWWESADQTVLPPLREPPPETPAFMGDWHRMVVDLLVNRFSADLSDRAANLSAFERHNARVRATVPARRLVEWQAGDGWEPLCAALDLPVPSEPFPHRNTRAEFTDRLKASRPAPT